MAFLRPRGRPRFKTSALLVLAFAASSTSVAAQSLEYAVKANFLARFTPFITWPESAFATSTAPFELCIIGDDPFGAAIDEAVRNQAVATHPIVVRRKPVADAGCHMMFIKGSTQLTSPIAIGDRLPGMLTVTDDGVNTEWAIIRFAVRNGRVRFMIDASAAQAKGLVISSKLLSLAVPSSGRGR